MFVTVIASVLLSVTSTQEEAGESGLSSFSLTKLLQMELTLLEAAETLAALGHIEEGKKLTARASEIRDEACCRPNERVLEPRDLIERVKKVSRRKTDLVVGEFPGGCLTMALALTPGLEILGRTLDWFFEEAANETDGPDTKKALLEILDEMTGSSPTHVVLQQPSREGWVQMALISRLEVRPHFDYLDNWIRMARSAWGIHDMFEVEMPRGSGNKFVEIVHPLVVTRSFCYGVLEDKVIFTNSTDLYEELIQIQSDD